MSWSDDETKRSEWPPAALEADAAMVVHRHSLAVVSGPRKGARFVVEGASVHIGSAPTNDVVLEDPTVSRHHCEISARGERYVVTDLESRNGTWVNGVQVLAAVLPTGAHLRLGDSELSFEPDRTWEALEASSDERFGELYGVSGPMRAVFASLERIAPTSLTCLLCGETGTGKDLAARAVHAASNRRDAPFVVVDCGALHRNLIESELFGHERGAFTGAERARSGAFEDAHGGTVFLDEIGELPLDLQPKLLRVLERREVRRLGGSQFRDVDVRVIAATHRDLPSMVEAGQFREDLLYRLAEVVVRLPPLRERKEDIPLLARRMLEQADTREGRISLGPDALAYLQAQPWPGNVRELRNLIRRAAAFARSDVIGEQALVAAEQMSVQRRRARAPTGEQTCVVEVAADVPIRTARDQWTATLEPEYVREVMRRTGGDIDAAAVHMGILRKSVLRLLRQHGLSDDET